MQRKFSILLILGLLLVLAGVALPYAGIAVESPVLNALVSAGVAMVAVAIIRTLRLRDEVQSDERTKKIGAYGVTYSWVFTLVLIAVLFWVDYLGLAALTAQGVLGILLFTMILSVWAFQWFLFRKGDVE